MPPSLRGAHLLKETDRDMGIRVPHSGEGRRRGAWGTPETR